MSDSCVIHEDSRHVLHRNVEAFRGMMVLEKNKLSGTSMCLVCAFFIYISIFFGGCMFAACI